jgi:hypothetical protein
MHTLCMTIKAKNFIKPQIISGLFRIPKQLVIFHQKVGHLSSCVPNHEWLLSKVPLFSKTGPEKTDIDNDNAWNIIVQNIQNICNSA